MRSGASNAPTWAEGGLTQAAACLGPPHGRGTSEPSAMFVASTNGRLRSLVAMPALHDLVLHGAAVWRAALAVLVLAGAVAGHQRSRRRARVEAGALRASLGSARTE